MTEEVKEDTPKEPEPWYKRLLTPQAVSAFIALITAISGVVAVLSNKELVKKWIYRKD